MTIRVVIADDHALVRDGLVALLEAHEDIQVVATAEDGRIAVAVAEASRPDVVVLDIAMPLMNGIEAARQIASRVGAKTIMLSMFGSAEHVHMALQAGASGYLLKETAGKDIPQAIRAVAKGQRFFCKSMARLVGDAEGPKTRGPLETLSDRERQVVQLTAEGHSSGEIAELLALSPKTVDTYRYRAMQKLGVSDFASLIRFAVTYGLTPAWRAEAPVENS